MHLPASNLMGESGMVADNPKGDQMKTVVARRSPPSERPAYGTPAWKASIECVHLSTLLIRAQRTAELDAQCLQHALTREVAGEVYGGMSAEASRGFDKWATR